MGHKRPSLSWVAAGLILAGTVLLAWHDATVVIPSDPYLFANAGSVMLSGQWTHTFAPQSLQAGPFELALCALARWVGGGGATGFAIALDLATTAAAVAVAASFLRRRPAALVVFGLGAFALGLPGAAYAGHPAEPLIGLLWLVAAREARRGEAAHAGLLVGASACLEVWGILGVAVLGLAPQLRRCVPGLALAAVVPTLCFLPFVLGGDFHMFSMQWVVLRGLPRLLLGYGRPFTWPLRVVEGIAIVSLGAAAARLARRWPEGVWLAPLVTAFGRILLDPQLFGYYWDTPLVIMLIGATALFARPRLLAARIGRCLAAAQAAAPVPAAHEAQSRA